MSQSTVRNLFKENTYNMAVEVKLLRPSLTFDPLSRERWPIGCQSYPNRGTIVVRFLESTMEILPDAVTLY